MANPNDDWDTFRNLFKNSFLQANDGTEAEWQAFKQQTGRWVVRSARTLFCYALLLVLAGVIDSVRGNIKRGGPAAAIGLAAALLLYAAWYMREGDYVKEIVLAKQRLTLEHRVALPSSAPEELKRLIQ